MTQAGLWWATGIAALFAVLAGAAEWRRSRRRDLDRVGFVPWGTVSVLAFLAAVVGFALGVRG